MSDIFDSKQEALLKDWMPYQANIYWKRRFTRTPYTSLWMIDYLINKANISYNEFLKDPKILKRVFNTDAKSIGDSVELDALSSLPGRCTSFTIQVVNEVNQAYEGKYEFQLYGLGLHRLARCKITGVLIDSGSSRGAPRLSEGDWPTFDRKNKWAWDSEEVMFKMKIPHVNGAILEQQELSQHEGMIHCLREVAESPQPLCYFRDISKSDGAKFYGWIKWHIEVGHPTRLELTEAPRAKEKGVYITFIWDEKGDQQSEKECVESLEQFVAVFGGSLELSEGLERWELCMEPHLRLWAAANEVGRCYPRVEGATILAQKD